MHVPIEHHRRIVVILLVAIFTLLFLLGLLIKEAGFFHKLPSYLQEEEVVIIKPAGGEEKATVLPIKKVLFEYIEVIDSCGPYFEGDCLNVRSGPGEDYPAVYKLRKGIVLKVDGKVERDGRAWYKIIFDEKIRHPDRITTDWYVSADYVRILLDEGDRDSKNPESDPSAKQIIVDRSEQKIYAYEKGELFIEQSISTGLELTPTPRGTFTIYKKTPSRYMQGPIDGITDQYYDLPGVPWDLYFTKQGAAIHGTYWHENFGKQSSHGCVNLPLAQAEKLYNWAEVGTRVIVQD